MVKKKKRATVLVLLTILIVSISVYIYWLEFLSVYKSTDNAYVSGYQATITAQQSGTIKAIYIDDTDYVKEGQKLIELDPTDYQLKFEQKKVELLLAIQKVASFLEIAQEKKADIEVKKAILSRLQNDLKSRQALIEQSAISTEEFTHAEADVRVAEKELELAVHQYNSAIANILDIPPDKHPYIEHACAALRDVYVQLQRCTIYSPMDGYVAKRNIQVGNVVNTSKSLMSVISLKDLWIDANFRETELKNISVGQSADITADVYGKDVKFSGIVVGISAGTGSVFTVLPPQNATGNWIKVTQRVPVRIALLEEDLKKYPLRLGMSVNVVINTQNNNEKNRVQPMQKKYQTSIYSKEHIEIENMMRTMIEENLNPYMQRYQWNLNRS